MARRNITVDFDGIQFHAVLDTKELFAEGSGTELAEALQALAEDVQSQVEATISYERVLGEANGRTDY